MQRSSGLRGGAFCAGLALAMLPREAEAQKNSGPLLPLAPPVTAPTSRPGPSSAAPSYGAPPGPQVTPQVISPRGGNSDADRLAQTLPIDTQTRELRDQLPADPRGTERRLGLREPRGPATDMRGGRTPSTREIVDALAPR